MAEEDIDKKIKETNRRLADISKSITDNLPKQERTFTRLEESFAEQAKKAEESGLTLSENAKFFQDKLSGFVSDAKSGTRSSLKENRKLLKSLQKNLKESVSGPELKLLEGQFAEVSESLRGEASLRTKAVRAVTEGIVESFTNTTAIIAGVAADSPIVAGAIKFTGDAIANAFKKRKERIKLKKENEKERLKILKSSEEAAKAKVGEEKKEREEKKKERQEVRKENAASPMPVTIVGGEESTEPTTTIIPTDSEEIKAEPTASVIPPDDEAPTASVAEGKDEEEKPSITPVIDKENEKKISVAEGKDEKKEEKDGEVSLGDDIEKSIKSSEKSNKEQNSILKKLLMVSKSIVGKTGPKKKDVMDIQSRKAETKRSKSRTKSLKSVGMFSRLIMALVAALLLSVKRIWKWITGLGIFLWKKMKKFAKFLLGAIAAIIPGWMGGNKLRKLLGLGADGKPLSDEDKNKKKGDDKKKTDGQKEDGKKKTDGQKEDGKKKPKVKPKGPLGKILKLAIKGGPIGLLIDPLLQLKDVVTKDTEQFNKDVIKNWEDNSLFWKIVAPFDAVVVKVVNFANAAGDAIEMETEEKMAKNRVAAAMRADMKADMKAKKPTPTSEIMPPVGTPVGTIKLELESGPITDPGQLFNRFQLQDFYDSASRRDFKEGDRVLNKSDRGALFKPKVNKVNKVNDVSSLNKKINNKMNDSNNQLKKEKSATEAAPANLISNTVNSGNTTVAVNQNSTTNATVGTRDAMNQADPFFNNRR